MENQNSGVLGIFNAAADKLSQIKDYLATASLDIGGRVATAATEMGVQLAVRQLRLWVYRLLWQQVKARCLVLGCQLCLQRL